MTEESAVPPRRALLELANCGREHQDRGTYLGRVFYENCGYCASQLHDLEQAFALGLAAGSAQQPEQDIERWRNLYRALAWMVNDYIGVNGISADFTKKHEQLGYAHEGYHNAQIVMRENKPPVPEGMQQGIRCKCVAKERGPFAGTRHEHYDEPPYSCARCSCKAYEPVAPPSGAPHQSGWRPIESAPKDASWFLGRLKDGDVRRVHYASDLSGSEQPAFQGFFYSTGNSMVECYPRHWMPLPAPPSDAKTPETGQ